MHRRHLLTFLLAGMTLPVSLMARANQQVLAARSWHHSDSTRLVLDLSGPVKYQTFELGSPPRLVVDLHGATLAPNLNEAALRGGPVKMVRSSRRAGGDTRLVFEFDRPVKSSSFTLAPSGGKGDRWVLDLHTGAPALAQAAAPAVAAAPLAKPIKLKPRDIVVVIDPGHGGKDPGALGAKGEQEKHVALNIARLLAKRINRTPGYKARLVRNADIFVPLRKRVEVAHKYNADLFISIHADAAPRRSASGASVFALSEHGATSTMARWMAKQENQADLLGSREMLDLSDKDPLVANVILDMSMNATIASSLGLGHQVITKVGKVAGVHQKRVEQAGFAVLKSPDIPSILVETGFISNLRDCRQLHNGRHQQKVAGAIFDGVHTFLSGNPPMGTYLADAKV